VTLLTWSTRHYHADHVGGQALPAPKTICHACELDSTVVRAFEALAIRILASHRDFVRRSRARHYTPTFETLRGDQEIARGVFLFETPGPHKGTLQLVVKLGGRRPCCLPQTRIYHSHRRKNADRSLHFDPIASIRSIVRLKELPKARADCSSVHDMTNLVTIASGPLTIVERSKSLRKGSRPVRFDRWARRTTGYVGHPGLR